MTRASVKHLAKDLHLVVIPFIAYFCCVVARPIVYPSTQVPGSPLRFVPFSAGYHRADFPLLLCFATEPKSTHLFLNRGAVASSPASSAIHPATAASAEQAAKAPPAPAKRVLAGGCPAHPLGLYRTYREQGWKKQQQNITHFFLSVRLSLSSYSNSKTIPASFLSSDCAESILLSRAIRSQPQPTLRGSQPRGSQVLSSLFCEPRLGKDAGLVREGMDQDALNFSPGFPPPTHPSSHMYCALIVNKRLDGSVQLQMLHKGEPEGFHPCLALPGERLAMSCFQRGSWEGTACPGLSCPWAPTWLPQPQQDIPPTQQPLRLTAALSPALCWCTLLVSVSFLLPFFFLIINFAFLACLSYFLPDWVFN